MTLKLVNTDAAHDGVFGLLKKENGEVFCVTLQHAYDSGNGDGSYTAKLKPGTYKCKLGPHRLAGMKSDFQTYEITGVKGHTGILFHAGNYNDDSHGCVLVGEKILPITGKTDRMITNSRQTFKKLMELQAGLDSFTLIVE